MSLSPNEYNYTSPQKYGKSMCFYDAICIALYYMFNRMGRLFFFSLVCMLYTSTGRNGVTIDMYPPYTGIGKLSTRVQRIQIPCIYGIIMSARESQIKFSICIS